MKVTVSIPNPLFEKTESLSKRLRIPRSRLYRRALRAFVREHSGDDITARMNAALARIGKTKEPGWESLGLDVLRRPDG